MENKIFTEKLSKLDSLFDRTIELVNEESNYSPDDENIKEIEKNLKEGQRKCKKQTFQIGVLALVKSGKSTFINSLLGAEYLPISNVPETARIVKIIHSKDHPEGHLLDKDNEKKIEGSKAIFKYLKELNKEMRDENYSNVSEEKLILKAPIECLKEKEFANVVFEILDTPGPNEAGAKPLENKVKLLLEKIDVIIYLLDYTKLKTAEEKELVDEISKRKDLTEKWDRLFFIINKVDMENRNGLTVQETPDHVCKLLKKQIPNISKEKILVVAAEKALVSRLILNKTNNQKVITDFSKKAFGEYGYRDKTIAHCLPIAPDILKDSRLLEVEDKVISFLFENRSSILVDSLSESLKGYISEFHNRIKVSEKAIQQTKETLESAIQQLEEDIEKLKKELGKINNIAKNTEREISDWINKEFEEFRNGILQIINMSFQYKRREVENSGEMKTGFKKKAFSFMKKFPKALELIDNLGKKFNDVFSQGEKISMKNEKETHNIFLKVKKVNEEIESYVRKSFDDFKHELESKAVSKQKELYEKFEEVVNEMARNLEQKVGKRFELILKKVEIKFPIDSIEEMHEKIQKEIEDLQERIKETKEEILVKKRSFGSDKYEDRYALNKSDLKKFWLKLIDEMNEVSISTAKHLAKKNIKKSIKMAKGKAENYANSYLDTMRRELEEKQKGKEEQKARAEMLSQSINKLNQVSQELEEMKMQ